MAKQVQTTLALEKTCKSCVRYSTKDTTKETVLLTIYIKNEAMKALGNPDEVTVTIEAAKTTGKK